MKRTIFTLFLLLAATSAMFAQETTLKSLLVSIEKYEFSPLDFAEEDVKTLGNLLQTRYNGTSQACIDMASNDKAPMQSVMEKIKTWCNGLKNGDTAILYLAGHGVKDENGKLYLAMTDFNGRNFDQAAIPLEWIREQYGNSEAKHKLLLLDTCYSGSSKSPDFNQAGAGEAGKVFSNLKDVVTIASSRDNQKSWLWRNEAHSMFTYWLIEAFKGHADEDGDRILTCKELIKYLESNVPWSADVELEKEQNPVILNAKAGDDFQLQMRAIPLEKMIDEVAVQIDLFMRLEKMRLEKSTQSLPELQIGIPEPTSGESKSFDPQYGTLSKLVADSLRKSLGQQVRKNRSGYEILSENAVRETLESLGVTPNDLGTEKTRKMTVNGMDIPILVQGHLLFVDKVKVNDEDKTQVEKIRSGINMTATLLNTDRKVQVGQARGAAILSQSNFVEAGISVSFTESGAAPPPVGTQELEMEPGIGLTTPAEQNAVDQMYLAANQQHPLAPTDETKNHRKNEMFDVWFGTRPIGSKGAYRKQNLQFRGNDAYLAIDKGVEYVIYFKSAYSDDVYVRVLVDGLNTLSQLESTISKAFVVVPAATSEGEYVVAPRVPLDEARPWFVPKGTSVCSISGFVDANGKSDTLRRFQVVDADQSVAARRNYTDQTGMITVAFYEAVVPTTRGGEAPPQNDQQLGTDMANPETVKLNYVTTNKDPDEMIAAYNIRYMTPEALKKLMQSWQ